MVNLKTRPLKEVSPSKYQKVHVLEKNQQAGPGMGCSSRPGALLEIGSAFGGSAIWFADMLRTYGLSSPVISIDLNVPNVVDQQVKFLKGDVHRLNETLTPNLLSTLPRPWLVVEDSAHTAQACMAALEFFSDAMNSGDILVIEDGVIDDLGFGERFQGGPNAALQEYFRRRPGQFEILTAYCDMFGKNATFNPNGYLRRI